MGLERQVPAPHQWYSHSHPHSRHCTTTTVPEVRTRAQTSGQKLEVEEVKVEGYRVTICMEERSPRIDTRRDYVLYTTADCD